MSDLISRKAVLKILHDLGGCGATDSYYKGWDHAISAAYDSVEELPTAYDVDKVVERIEALADNCEENKLIFREMRVYQAANDACLKEDAYKNAIEIVKRGGVNA